MGGRGSGSAMSSSTSGGFTPNQQSMEDYAVAVGMFDRDFMKTAEGREALREFIDDEIEAGLTERDMRQAIRDTSSSSGRSTNSRNTGATGGGRTYTVSEVPSRIQSFTVTGTGASGDYESKTYVTRKGDAIKTTTKYSDGTRTTSTDMRNYGTGADRTRAQFESTLAGMAKSHIRTGSKVTAIDDKKKG